MSASPATRGADWRVFPELDERLFQAYARAAARALWDRARGSAGGGALADPRMSDASERCPSVAWLPPEAYWILSRELARSAELAERAGVLLRSAVNLPPPTRALTGGSPWVEHAFGSVERDLRAAGFDSALEEVEAGWEGQVANALRLLEAAWPEAAWELGQLVREVAVVRSRGLRSASVPQVFGLVLIGHPYACSTVRLSELLLHETAHLSLTVREGFGPFLENASELAASPLRPDPRPLDAVLHAAFVLRRVCHFLERLEGEAEGVRLLSVYTAQLKDVLETLRSAARWTSRGRALFQALAETPGRS